MKKILLLLCALMFAAPVFAADPAPAAAGATQAEPVAKPAKDAPKKAKKKKQKKAAAKSAAPMACPTGCSMMPCPTVVKCCNTATHQPC